MSEPILSQTIGWTLLAGFSVVWIFLGWFWGRRAATFDGYMLAGRNIGLALGTATAMAVWLTSTTTMAAPQWAYQLGVWGMVGYSLGGVGLLLFAPMAERIKHLMPSGYTSGDFVRLRLGKANWIAFLFISFFYGLTWLVSLGMAGGILLQALTGISYHAGMLAILTVCVGFTVLGGLRAVVGTDYLQSLLILAGLVASAVAVYSLVGTTETHRLLSVRRPGLLNLLMPASLIFLFNNLLFGLGEIFHGNGWWARALAFRKGTGFRAYLIAGFAWLPVPALAGFLALAAPVMNINVPALDMVGPIVAATILGSTGAVLILIVVFAALASSLDSLLAATSSLLVEDVYRRVFRPGASGGELRLAARAFVVILGALAVLLCWGRLTTLAETIQFTGAFVASTIWPIAAGLYWPHTNRHSTLAGMVLGTLAGLWAYFGVGFYAAALVGGGVSMLCVAVGSKLYPQSFDWAALTALRPPEDK